MEDKRQDQQIIYGIHPVLEALESGARIDRVFMEKTHKGPNIDMIRQRLKEQEIPLLFVPSYKLDRLTRKNHQGVVAMMAAIEFMDIEEIVTSVQEQGRTPFILALDGVTDVRNFGAIARTAECAGVDALLIPMKETAPINEDAIKTSSGALLRMPVCRTKNFRKTLENLKNYGLSLVACSEKGTESIYDDVLSEATVIVMGAEGTGISEEVLKMSDHVAAIPMKGVTASLNVSVACGIILFETLRQRDLRKS